jgi:hypothetical protein
MAMPPVRPAMNAGVKRVAAKKAAAKPVKWEEQYAEGSAARPAPGGKATLGYLVGKQYRNGVNAKSEESYGMLSDRKKPTIIPNLAINLAKSDVARSGQFKKK